MLYRLVYVFILTLSIMHASHKLDPAYDIPDHVQFILRMYDAIDREDQSIINPDAFYSPDVHRAMTLFFDPHWEEKGQDIPTGLDNLENHYNKLRKICTSDFTKILTPYWAHGKSLEVLESFDRGSYIKKENVLNGVPIIFHDALTGIDVKHPDHLNILIDLNSAKVRKSPTYSHSRQLIPLTLALPTEIENPLFLMTLADNMDYLVGTLLDIMKLYNSGEIEADQFAHAFKTALLPHEYLKPAFRFEYIIWYMKHYDVFGENAAS